MNQAQSRRFRTCPFLLLLPLLMASTPPLSAVTAGLMQTNPPAGSHLAWVNLPPELLLNQCVPVKVELRDSTEAPIKPLEPMQILLSSTLLGGSFYDSSSCSSSTDSVSLSVDVSSVQVWYRSNLLGAVKLSAQDSQSLVPGAVSPVLSVVESLTTSLEMSGLPTIIQAGAPVTVTVAAKTLTNPATGYSGTLHFTSTDPHAQLPPDYTFNPAVDQGTKTFTLVFKTAGQWELRVQDVNNSNLQAQNANSTVQPGPATHFELVGLPLETTAGVSLDFKVDPLDAFGNLTSYSGKLHFSSAVLRATLPQDMDVNLVPMQEAQATVTFLSADPAPKLFTVTDTSSGQNLTGSVSILVKPGAFKQVVLFSNAPGVLPACASVQIDLKAEDNWGNLLPDASINNVKLCASSGSSASLSSTTLDQAVVDKNCVTGSFTGHAQAIWADSAEEAVTFSLSGASVEAPLTITWKAGLPSNVTSTLTFRESSEDPAPLRTYSGVLSLVLTLRDLCGQPAALPPNNILTFSAQQPLHVSPSPVQESPDQWSVTVRLPECPAEPSQPLVIQPLINGEPTSKPNGEPAQRLIQPQCLPSQVELSFLTPEERRVAQPGGPVELEVQVSNTLDRPVPESLLMLAPTGMSVVELSLDGQDLAMNGGGFVLPALRKDAPITLKLTAQATTQLQGAVNTEVWLTYPDGTALTEKHHADFTRQDAGVDVGCASTTTGLPSQLLPWLLLLLVASRPWVRLHRLWRSERTDP